MPVDITWSIDDPEDMPLCPCCDQPIYGYEDVEIGVAHGTVALIHRTCALEALS